MSSYKKVDSVPASDVADIYRKYGKLRVAREYNDLGGKQLSKSAVLGDIIRRRNEFADKYASNALDSDVKTDDAMAGYVEGIRPFHNIESDLSSMFIPFRKVVVTTVIIIVIVILLILINWGIYEKLERDGMYSDSPWIAIFGVHIGLGGYLAGSILMFMCYLIYDGIREWSGEPLSLMGEKYFIWKWRPSGLFGC